MTICIIVAVASDGGIGRRGELLWHIGADLKRFKAFTMGHPVIMGRKTFESLPKGALPGRTNIVLTHDPSYAAPGALVAGSVDSALALASEAPGAECVWVMGGEQIYNAMLPMASRLYITRIDLPSPEGTDAYFRFDRDMWQMVSEECFSDHRLQIFERRDAEVN